MQRFVAVLILSLAFATGAFAQATLRIGDPVELRIGGVPAEDQNQVNNTYSVDTGGSINLPFIGKVHAQGLTPAQLSRAIEDNYRSNKVYTNPNITIIMAPTARFVNVGGSVRNPTRVPFTEDMTLLTAVNAAGGFNDFADQRHVRLLRGSEATVFDVRKFRKDPSQDVKLRPGDKIEVPQSFF